MITTFAVSFLRVPLMCSHSRLDLLTPKRLGRTVPRYWWAANTEAFHFGGAFKFVVRRNV